MYGFDLHNVGLKFVAGWPPQLAMKRLDEDDTETLTSSSGDDGNAEEGDSYEMDPLFGKGWKMTSTV